MELPPPGELFASVLFGIIGLAAFTYGKKSMAWKPMVIGVLLMVFPYAVSGIWLIYLVGVALCIALYFFRD
jgi:hypothetical protein